MSGTVEYRTDPAAIDWDAMKAVLSADGFDNGRSPAQLATSFRNSHSFVVACDGERIVGTARALSDGVCNAYVVDVWTHSSFRRRGIARKMIEALESGLQGQHVALFTDDAHNVFTRLDYESQNGGMSRVLGTWLRGDSP